MKKLLLLFLLSGTCAFAQPSNSIDSLKSRMLSVEKSIVESKNKISALESELANSKRTIEQQSSTIESQSATIDSLENVTAINKENIKSTAESLGVKIKETDDNLQTKADNTDLKNKSYIGIGMILVIVLIILLVYFILHSRINKGSISIEELKSKADKLNEEIINKFSLDMAEVKKIADSLGNLSKAAPQGAEPDHSLIKLLADRITFMEMTLFKMDPKVRGYRQLSSSIAQMKDNLTANGYEIVDMLGKPYNDGMKVSANFIEDEELEEGTQIITGIIKPQINYKGVMIQSAQITVSQNL